MFRSPVLEDPLHHVMMEPMERWNGTFRSSRLFRPGADGQILLVRPSEFGPVGPCQSQDPGPEFRSHEGLQADDRPITSLEDGELRRTKFLIPKGEDCFYRCVNLKDEYHVEFTDWIRIEVDNRPKCDFVEVSCGRTPEKPSYRYLHTQIYVDRKNDTDTATIRKSPQTFPTTSEMKNESSSEGQKWKEHRHFSQEVEKPGVVLMIVDSVSMSAMARALPSTLKLLQDDFGAVVFRHFNKIELNSAPNGAAFLVGTQIYDIYRSPYSDAIPADVPQKEWCFEQPMDNRSFIAFPFRDAGYKTMMAEDWIHGTFLYPACVGFTKKHVDHYNRAYILRVEGSQDKGGDPKMANIVYKESCREPQNTLLDYLSQFLKAYEDQAKFSISWISQLGHDRMNNVYHADKDFYKFFHDNRERLRNSFIIFMGDHGMRYGDFRDSKFGAVEDNNPGFVMAVPEKLRNSSLMQIVKENSKSLFTPYDLYATLNDIASVLPESNFTDFSPLDLNKRLKGVFHGSSLLRPLPQPRHCGNLRIPFEYCTCEVNYKALPPTDELLPIAEQFLIDELNAEIRSFNASDTCAALTLQPNSSSLEQLDVAPNLFQITTVAKPSGGKFNTLITAHRSENGTLKIERATGSFSRLNSYHGQSDCLKDVRIEPICFCKK
ncbi:hypothetical protein L596_022844 [Steinernema carpocapsae]|uniref:Uncharacterized protein n=1 Tax=Steinernema carpocapsae TaxID=34508 RepID=A0A4U5MMY1_STECR|nr:hypothetical protein L596_022844 [Steinernema carpocapsae]